MTLIKTDVSEAVTALVETIIPRGSGQDGSALYIRLDIRGWDPGSAIWEGERLPLEEAEAKANEVIAGMPEGLDEDDYPWPEESKASANVHLLIFRPTNYTQVYAVLTDSWDIPGADAGWVLQVDHDSCWRTDGFRILNDVWNRLRDATTPSESFGFTHLCFIANVRRMTIGVESVPDVHTGPGRKRVTYLKKDWPEGHCEDCLHFTNTGRPPCNWSSPPPKGHPRGWPYVGRDQSCPLFHREEVP